MIYIKIFKSFGIRTVALVFENKDGVIELTTDRYNIMYVTGWTCSDYLTLPDGEYEIKKFKRKEIE